MVFTGLGSAQAASGQAPVLSSLVTQVSAAGADVTLGSLASRYSPANGSTVIRPDTRASITVSPGSEFQGAFANSAGSVGLYFKPVGGYGAKDPAVLLTEANGQVAVTDGVYGSVTVSTTGPLKLDRYTTYDAYLVVRSAYNQLVAGHAAGDIENTPDFQKNSAEWSFTTGSAIGEPTHWTISTPNPKPIVTVGGQVEVESRDDYGDQATTGNAVYTSAATIDGSVLDASFGVSPSATTNGSTSLEVTDHKAQAVSISVNGTGPYPAQDNASLNEDLAFQPGPPAEATLSAGATLTVDNSEEASGTAKDIYGNLVNPSAMDLNASAGSIVSPVTTNEGSYQSAFTAPTKLTSTPGTGEKVDLGLKSEEGSATAATSVVVNPGAPTTMSLTVSKSTVAPNGTVTVSGELQDAYGNAVLDGTSVSLTATAGAVTQTASTVGGAFTANFTAPSSGGDVTITAGSGEASASVTVNVQSLGAPDGSHIKISYSKNANASYNISGTLVDPNGNPVPGVTITIWDVGTTSTVKTDASGAFSYVTTPSPNHVVFYTTSESGKRIVTTFGMNTLIYGDQQWTDTGLSVSSGDTVIVDTQGWTNSHMPSWYYSSYGGVMSLQCGNSSEYWWAKTDLQQGSTTYTYNDQGYWYGSPSGPVHVWLAPNVPVHLYLGPPWWLSWYPNLKSTNASATITIEGTNENPMPTMNLNAPNPNPPKLGGTSTISGSLSDDGIPVTGVTIALSLSGVAGGSIPATVATDSNGNFSFTYTSGTQGGKETVTASYAANGQTVSQSDSFYVEAPPVVSSVSISTPQYNGYSYTYQVTINGSEFGSNGTYGWGVAPLFQGATPYNWGVYSGDLANYEGSYAEQVTGWTDTKITLTLTILPGSGESYENYDSATNTWSWGYKNPVAGQPVTFYVTGTGYTASDPDGQLWYNSLTDTIQGTNYPVVTYTTTVPS